MAVRPFPLEQMEYSTQVIWLDIAHRVAAIKHIPSVL